MQEHQENRYSNHILDSLDEDTYRRLEPEFRTMELKRGESLMHAGERPSTLYFPLHGSIVSLLVATDGGAGIEAALTGNEGVVGISTLLGNSVNPHEVMVQCDGTVVRIRAELVQREMDSHLRLRRALLAYSNFVLAQISQVALCNRLHQVEERMARWLLLFQDRADSSSSMVLTHELMSQMLGSRRATVSLCASTLQNAGLISYVHGKVRIVDRQGLEGAACECYAATKRQYSDYLSQLGAKSISA